MGAQLAHGVSYDVSVLENQDSHCDRALPSLSLLEKSCKCGVRKVGLNVRVDIYPLMYRLANVYNVPDDDPHHAHQRRGDRGIPKAENKKGEREREVGKATGV